MAQHDYNLANQSGADFRADLNNALAAIVTVNSGATSPSTTFAHQLWVDTANNLLKIRNTANDAWITTGVSITADNTFTGNITGNASTATALETARTINGASFDGTANISFDTDSVSEGNSNLYFTNARVESYLDAGTSTPTFASAVINSSITGSAVLDDDTFATASATTVATSESIKAYVDSQVGSVDTLAEILLNGNTTGGTDIEFGDNDKAIFGTGSDLQIYHDGSNSIIKDAGAGNLELHATNLVFKNADSSLQYASFISGGAAELRYNGSPKLATTSTGIDVTGTVTSDGLTVDGEGRIEETGDAARLVIARTDNANATESASMDLLESNGGGSFGTASNYGFRLDIDGSANTFNIKSGVQTSVTKRFQIGRDTGDISFYDDTGSTQGFFWDASAESLGIGTTSPDKKLDVLGDIRSIDSSSNQHQLRPTQIISYATDAILNAQSTGDDVRLNTQGTTRLIATAEGSVGIGTSSPDNTLMVQGASSTGASSTGNVALFEGPSGTNGLKIFIDDTENAAGLQTIASDDLLLNPHGGSVGIGTSSPADELHVNGSGDTTVRVTTSSTSLEPKLVFVDGSGDYASLEKVNRDIKIKAFNTDVAYFTNGGRVGIGTSSPSYLLHIDNVGGGDGIALQDTNDAGSTGLHFLNNSGTIVAEVSGLSDNTGMTFETAGSERMRIDSSGKVGIGTTSPTQTLNIKDDVDSSIGLLIENTSAAGAASAVLDLASASQSAFRLQQYIDGSARVRNLANSPLMFYTNNTERMRIDSSGNVGIGTTSPSNILKIFNTANSNGVDVENTNASFSESGLLVNNTSSTGGNLLRLRSFGSDKVVVLGTGSVGIGTSSPSGKVHSNVGASTVAFMGGGTVTDPQYPTFGFDGQIGSNGGRGAGMYLPADGTLAWSTVGSERMRIDSSGNLLVGKTSNTLSEAGAKLGTGGSNFTRNSAEVIYVNRTTSDGSLITLAKDGSTVGSISAAAGTIRVNGTDGSGLYFANASVFPSADNVKDLGVSSNRYKDIYATNGTIQTSDINEKQDIEDLSEAETRVAVAAKGLLKKYRWKSAVADKGDDARIHFGIMAQDLENAFANEGLDAGDYGMFISSTWTDEATGEEKTRLGVRYNELLAFIIAAI